MAWGMDTGLGYSQGHAAGEGRRASKEQLEQAEGVAVRVWKAGEKKPA